MDGVHNDKLAELQAEFEHFRKRTACEQRGAERRGALEAVQQLLPAVSNLERAIRAAHDAGMSDAILQGLVQIHREFAGRLAELGIERIPARGQAFDPRLHEAVEALPTARIPAGTVVDEVEPGYAADGRTLVAAKVRVAVPLAALSA